MTKTWLQLMSKALQERMERWTAFLMFISLRAMLHFTYYMHKRGDSGKLKFNHRKQRLEIRVRQSDAHSRLISEDLTASSMTGCNR